MDTFMKVKRQPIGWQKKLQITYQETCIQIM